MKDQKKKKVIFIVGSGHCGSTLLDMLLDSHSRVFGVGELTGLSRVVEGENIMCTCGLPARKCDVWESLVSNHDGKDVRIYQKKKNIFLNRNMYHTEGGYMLNNRKYIRDQEDIYRKLFLKTGVETIVDSTKRIERVILMQNSKIIEPLLIHIVRDGRAVSWSYIRKYKVFLPFICKWFLSNIKIEILKRRFKGKKMFVRYEDLIKDPSVIIKQILNMAELESETGILQFRDFKHHQIGGNRMRISQISDIKEDVVWRKKMPHIYRFVFSVLFGWMNVYYRRKNVK